MATPNVLGLAPLALPAANVSMVPLGFPPAIYTPHQDVRYPWWLGREAGIPFEAMMAGGLLRKK